ncbi:uncharacterized protein LOC131009706 [Salvia miltiorrhiza]|uniref:uncharacterized protein LOC131009706 n=1 Tax=Salvia miltiorrhiza TaxID=226208 RepID=UPI0025AB7CF1|nr:uncharacterized protein LOC131009706 [Salvia miltiorrhiza]
MLEMKVGQIAESLSNQNQKGQFPSNSVVNPKEHCKAITVRSGMIFEESKISPEVKNNDESISSKMQGDKEEKKDVYKVHINIPLIEALQQMPKYAKFLKEVISTKKKWEEFETINLTEECCAVLQKKLPLKIKDPVSFTIPCDIGTIKPTTIVLQMADRSISYPKGIVEDVLVRVEKFIFPVDFVVLDMVEDKDVPLILRRPFLATGRSLIDVAKGELTLRVNDESVTFLIHKAPKHKNEDEGMRVDERKLMQVIEPCINMKENLKEEKKEEKAQGLELKLLPTHLKYAFLGEDELHPMGQARVLQLNELDEYRAFENLSFYKEKTKNTHDEMMQNREFAPDDEERIKTFLPLKPNVEVFVGTIPVP